MGKKDPKRWAIRWHNFLCGFTGKTRISAVGWASAIAGRPVQWRYVVGPVDCPNWESARNTAIALRKS